jgi:hypothetical protein
MTPGVSTLVWSVLLVTCLLGVPAAATTDVKIVKLAADGYTVLNETTLDYRWMEQHLPVKGDGSTHYYLQGPVFVDPFEDRWNPAEDTNVKEKDMGAVKGTDLADLCSVVGGMADGDEVMVRASDGFSRTFAYENVFNPPSRQGPIIISWYHGTYGYVPAYPDGMRLLFLADTSGNPWGIHALGAWDWHESAGEKYWYYYYNGNEQYPTTTGLSVRSVSEIVIYSHEEPAGTIRVTSLPEGAQIFIDGEDGFGHTPADVPGIPAGIHMVRVELAGYEVPEEIPVDVGHQQIAEAEFDLMEIPVDTIPGTADSSGPGEAKTGIGSGTAGSELTPATQGVAQGNVSIILIPELNGSITGGDKRGFRLSGPPPGQDLLLSRLYIFTSNATDRRSGLGTVPEFELAMAGSTFNPDRVYQDQGANRTDGMVTTTVFTLSDVPVPNQAGVTLHLKDNPETTCVLQGGAWITVSGDPGGSPYSSWIFEGADMIASPPGKEQPDADTTAEFELNATGPVFTHGMLRVVSTGEREELASRYQILINGEALPGISAQYQGRVVTLEVPFHPPTPGSPLRATIRATIHEKSGLYGETRLAVFTLMSGAKQPPVPGNVTPFLTAAPAGEIVASNSSHTLNEDTGNQDGTTSSPTVNIAGTTPQSPASWLSLLTDRIYSFLVLLFGEPAGPAAEDHKTEDPARYNQEDPAHLQGIQPAVSEIPEISLPEESAGEPDEITVTGVEKRNRMDEVSILPIQAPGGTSGTPGGYKPRHGGVYVTSYPEDVELRIDTLVVNTHLPAVVYGLKEGTHQVEVRLKSDTDRIIGAKSSRVWIPADAVTTARFDLVGIDPVQKIRVVSPDGASDPFTVNGYYPLRRTPSDVDFMGEDSFVTVIRDHAYLTFTPVSVTEPGTIMIPAEMPRLYRIMVESTPPGGDIIVDGMQSGYQTPTIIPNISAGLHRITVYRPGYIPGESVILIPVDDDLDVKDVVHYVLETYPCGPLTIDSIPGGASISLDGISTGEKTPYTFMHIPLGIHEVSVVRNGESRKSDVVVKPDDSRRYIIMFEGNGTRVP